MKGICTDRQDNSSVSTDNARGCPAVCIMPPWISLQVFTARLEANDNMKYLRTLEDWFDKLNDDGDFPKLLEVCDVVIPAKS